MDASRSWAFRTPGITAAVRPRLIIPPAAVVVAAVLGAWLVNFMDWSFGCANGMVAVCAASLVATTAIAAGWASQPEELGRWAIRAGAAAFVSALPFLAG